MGDLHMVLYHDPRPISRIILKLIKRTIDCITQLRSKYDFGNDQQWS